MSIGSSYMLIEQSSPLQGTAYLDGAKNAVLVIMASLILTNGVSILTNVSGSEDVRQMIALLESLGAHVIWSEAEHKLSVDTSTINHWAVPAAIMNKMRASILVLGPLLARFGTAVAALPGGCVIGTRPIDYHISCLMALGVHCEVHNDYVQATVNQLCGGTVILDYPSVGATENVLMAAVCAEGVTRIVNAALEPEVIDLIAVLRAMGAHIEILPPAIIEVVGVDVLRPIHHAVMYDRLEAGALILAGAITGGVVHVPQAPAHQMEIFLHKLRLMGHRIVVGQNDTGVTIYGNAESRAVHIKTGPYPAFPTDLQAPMMAAQTLALGGCIVEETVFENRLLHVRELQKMGAQIAVDGNKAMVTGVDELYGAQVIATDIRAACALVLAGLVAHGATTMTGISHWRRGYGSLEKKLAALGARIMLVYDEEQNDSLLPEYNRFPVAQVE